MKNYMWSRPEGHNRHEKLSVLCGVPRYTRDTRPDGFILRSAGPAKGSGGSNLDAHQISEEISVRMLLSFQRPSRPAREVLLPARVASSEGAEAQSESGRAV